MDIQPVDAYPPDMDILDAVHGRGSPITLHGDVMHHEIQAVRSPDDIPGRGVCPAFLFPGCVEADDTRYFHVIGTPDINHGVLELCVMHL